MLKPFVIFMRNNPCTQVLIFVGSTYNTEKIYHDSNLILWAL